ncbi:unnamed protein product [Rotaria magnacalcarata]|nr:unnamed protein product [Rotaria magnacalcarata]CAF3802729.1 unnamed protein product [Rotaria magnacalcarata]CAF3814795.1 unnamed protein product [Rotaria magnacalcarata]
MEGSARELLSSIVCILKEKCRKSAVLSRVDHVDEDEEGRRKRFLAAFQRIMDLATPESDEYVHNVQCRGCNVSPVRKDRYSCLQCSRYDLCGACFDRRYQSNQHTSGHLVAHFRLPNEICGHTMANTHVSLSEISMLFHNERHVNTCDGCRQHGFSGLRFKCDICADYDLCERCATHNVVSKGHTTKHPLVLASDKTIPAISMNDIKCGQLLGEGGFGTCLFLCCSTSRISILYV